jgi:hypothetical protein
MESKSEIFDRCYGDKLSPQERRWQIIGEAIEQCTAEVSAIVDEYHRQWVGKYPEMRADSYEVVASKPRVRPMRSNYNSEAGKGDE